MNESVCNRNGLRAGGTFFCGVILGHHKLTDRTCKKVDSAKEFLKSKNKGERK